MKKVAVFLLVLFFTSFSIHAQELDNHMKKVVRSLKQKDEKAYLQLFPTYEQMVDFLKQVLEQTSDASDITKDSLMQVTMKGFTKEKYENDIEGKLAVAFRNFLEEGETKGLNWTDIEFAGYTADTSDIEKVEGMQSATGKIFVKFNDKDYTITYSDVIWMNNQQAWFGILLNGVLKPGEAVTGASDDSDSLAMMMTPPPPPPALQKKAPVKKAAPKSKTTSKPAATKNKTTAKPLKN
jgi:hypothetical protein